MRMKRREPQRHGSIGVRELGLVLDEEAGGLPEKHQAVVVLCELEGRSRQSFGSHRLISSRSAS